MIKNLIAIFYTLIGLNSFGSEGQHKVMDMIKSDYANILQNVGLNCLDPSRAHQNYIEFMKEVEAISSGVSMFTATLALLNGGKKDYPNVCNLLTKKQLGLIRKDSVLEDATSKMGVSKKTFSTSISYFWPKYLIETYRTGNGNGNEYIKNNFLYTLNRKLATPLKFNIDSKIVNSAVKNILGDFAGGFGKSYSILGHERYNGNTSTPRYDSTIWPIVGSYQVAKNLTVCGQELYLKGKTPGGIKWPVPIAPMTCPIAKSEDAFHLWDSGFLDLSSPEGIKSIVTSANPALCQFDYIKEIIAQKYYQKAKSLISSPDVSTLPDISTRNAMLGCSYPITSSLESILKNNLDLSSKNPFRKLSCTPWGPLYPRTSTLVSDNDYSFGNIALRFKLFANDIFGVEKGAYEKITLADPWDDRSSNLYDFGDPRLNDSSLSLVNQKSAIEDQVKSGLVANIIQNSGVAKAIALDRKRKNDIKNGNGNIVSSDSRTHVIWEEIKCKGPRKIEVNTGLTSIKKYESCRDAIKNEVRIRFQESFLRTFCNMTGNFEGSPWKKN